MHARTAAHPATREAWRILGELFRDHKPHWMAGVSELGLSPMQAIALVHMDPDAPQPMSAVAGAMHCDNSNITGIADRLEAVGLVERRPAAHDRRVKELVLTPSGRALRARVEELMADPPAPLAALDAGDAETLLAILRRATSR